MKVTLLALGGLLAAASFCACSNNDNENMNSMVNGTDSVFVKMAGMGNYAEVDAANLAKTKSADTAILNFANMMIADHTAAQASLKTIAAKYSLTVPDSLDAAHIATKEQLSLLSGRAFDSAYISQQVLDHQATIQLFQTEQTSGNNTDLGNFADTTLPKLQMHLAHANSIDSTYHQ